MTTITLNCLSCSKPFEGRLVDIRRGQAKYCSQSCCAKHTAPAKRKKRIPNTTCAYCSVAFWSRNVAKGNCGTKSGLRFCCREHKDLSQRIGGITAIQPTHYKGKTQPSIHGYRDYALKHLPYKCNRCNFDDKRILVVHHKDRNRENNDISNLEILCPNCHAIEHWFPDQK